MLQLILPEKIGILIQYMIDLFSFFRTKQLKPVWEFDAGSLIWRIFFGSTNKIVGESRNESTKITSYFCIDAHSGLTLWKDFKLDESWWVGIETVYDRWIILHGYARPDMPEHRGIHAMDIESGKVIWKNDELTFWFIEDKKLYAQKYSFENRIGYELDIITGEVILEYADNLDILYDKQRNSVQNRINEQRDLLFSELYNTNQSNTLIDGIIQQITGGKALNGWIEYFINKDVLLLSYYQEKQKPKSRLLNNVLTVYNLRNQKIIFNRIIAKELQVPNHDTFFIKDDLVYFIKNQSTLTALKPWK